VRALGADVTFAEAARKRLRYVKDDRACKPSTMLVYRSSVSALRRRYDIALVRAGVASAALP